LNRLITALIENAVSAPQAREPTKSSAFRRCCEMHFRPLQLRDYEHFRVATVEARAADPPD